MKRLLPLVLATLVLVAVAEFLYLQHLRKGAPPPSPAGTPAVEIPSRGSLQERQMSRGVYVAGVPLEALVASEAAFTEGLRLFLDSDLPGALAAFQRTNSHPLNRFRRYSFYYQAHCQERLGSTELRDLYLRKGWVVPGQYEFFFAQDQAGMTRYLLGTLCGENVEALAHAARNYAAGHDGAPPPSLAALVPDHVNRVPTCPATGTDAYGLEGCSFHRSPTDLFDPDFFVGWTILEDYAEQHRFATWNALLRKAADLRPGEVVADVGCGRGLFTFSFAEAVGPQGLVYAVDLNPGVLRFVDFEAARLGDVRVRTVRATERDVSLPADSVDAVFLISLYHVLVPEQDPRNPENLRQNLLPWLATVQRALKPGGRFLIQDGRIDPAIVREQVTQAGFEHTPDRELTPKLETPSLSVFRKPL